MVDVIEDIIYREQSMPMPASLEARVFLPGLRHESRYTAYIYLIGVQQISGFNFTTVR